MARKERLDGYLTRLNAVRYLGSHHRIAGIHDNLTVVFYPERIALCDKKLVEQIAIPVASIRQLTALDRDEIESQVTATRVIFLGALAWVAKKSTKFSFLEIADQDGSWLFAIPNLSSIELRSGLDPVRRRYGIGAAAATAPAADPAARIQQLDELWSRGLVSAEEYQQQRARILSEL